LLISQFIFPSIYDQLDYLTVPCTGGRSWDGHSYSPALQLALAIRSWPSLTTFFGQYETSVGVEFTSRSTRRDN